jgi:hypothetical protein
VTSIQAPTQYLQVGTAVQPAATVFNSGDTTVSFEVHLAVRDTGGVVHDDSLPVSNLAPQASQQVTFPSWTPGSFDYYEFMFWTALVGDQYPGDDTLALNTKCFHDAYPGLVWPPFSEMTVGYALSPIVKVWNDGSYLDTIAVALGIFDSAGNQVYQASENIAGVAAGESALASLPLWSGPAHAGRYLAKADAHTMHNDFIPGNDSLSQTFLGSWEITYDDGTPEAYYDVGRGDNDKFYVRFTPTAPPPFEITGGRIYVNTANTPFAYVAVCPDDGTGHPDTTTILQQVDSVMATSAPAWADFGLSISRNDDNDLWLIAAWINNKLFGIGADRDSPIDFRSYFSSNQDTFYQWPTADWMMRLTQVPGATGVSNTSNLHPQYVFGLSPSRPNPFHGATRVSYSLAAKAQVALRIYDPSGREVCTLTNGEQAAGPHGVNWDGRDIRGKPAPAGVYFCRMQVVKPELTFTRKLLLLR